MPTLAQKLQSDPAHTEAFIYCTRFLDAATKEEIIDASQFKQGGSYIFSRPSEVIELDVGEGGAGCSLPWYDVRTRKAYKQGIAGTEEALVVVPGPNGVALACFASSAPLEVPGLSNAALATDTADDHGAKDERQKDALST